VSITDLEEYWKLLQPDVPILIKKSKLLQ
jgi:hypothetical protein